MNQQAKPLSNAVIGIMGGVALLFDTLQALFSWIGLGWLLIPFEYLTFIIWFKFYGLNFLSLKRVPSLAGGAVLELITAGIAPAFTAVVLRVAFTSRINQDTA